MKFTIFSLLFNWIIVEDVFNNWTWLFKINFEGKHKRKINRAFKSHQKGLSFGCEFIAKIFGIENNPFGEWIIWKLLESLLL